MFFLCIAFDINLLYELPVDVMVVKELEFIGSSNMPVTRFEAMLNMIEGGVLQPEKMITKKVNIEEAADILADMGEFKTPGLSVVNQW